MSKYLYTTLFSILFSAAAFAQPVIESHSADNDTCTGWITISGYTPPMFTWTWNRLEGSDTIFVEADTYAFDTVCAGNYLLIMDSSAADTFYFPFTIFDLSAENPLNISVNTQNDLDNQCDGAAWISTPPGTAPHTYVWSSNGSENHASALCAGIYSVGVTDAMGLTGYQEFVIYNEEAIYNGGSYEDSTPAGYLTPGLVENCSINYNGIDSVALNALLIAGNEVIVTWEVYSSTDTVYITDTLNYGGGAGVWEITYEAYCPQKSVPGFALFTDRIYLNSAELSLTESTTANAIIYPNPFNDKLSIRMENAGDYTVELFDAAGRKLLSQNFFNTDLMSLSTDMLTAAGTYLVKISDGNSSATQLIVR